MTIEEQNKILKKAIFEMGKFIRQNPPSVLDGFFEYEGILPVLAGGMHRDPEGKEYVYYFVDRAKKEMEKNKEL